MIYKFTAEVVSVEEDDDCVVVGLADDAADPSRHLILQNAKAYDEQDRLLQMDHVHLEIGGGSESCYGGLEKVSLLGDVLALSLSVETQGRLGIKGGIEVLLATREQRGRLEQALEQMCAAEAIPFVRSKSSHQPGGKKASSEGKPP